MAEPTLALTLSKNLTASIRAGHPWVYRQALLPKLGWPEDGQIIDVLDRDGKFVARGLYSVGPIAFRVLTTRRESIHAGFVEQRVRAAQQLRQRVLSSDTTAYRLLYGENDGIPGIVVDVYNQTAIVKLDGTFANALLPWVTRALEALGTKSGEPFTSIVLRDGRGETKSHTVLAGVLPEEPLFVLEHGMHMRVSTLEGQKTGLFLDHRESRKKVREIANGLRVLNLYGYTGGFSTAAALGGAKSVDTVDVAKEALRFAELSFADNQLTTPHRTHVKDVPAFLDEAKGLQDRWDLIVCDPPSFAPNEAAKTNALAGYRRLHRACLSLIENGGFYLAASCSSHVGREDFLQSIEQAAEKSDLVLTNLGSWSAAADHPVRLAFPESDYLKCFLFQVRR